MKKECRIPSAECGTRSAESRNTPHASRPAPHAPRPTHHERAIALVVTLLLLSIITFMVVTFLVVSRSQKGSVTTATDQAIARLAADMALERAKAAIIAPMLAWTNQFSYGLMVSTNYVNLAGFDQSLTVPGPANPTNVNYDYTRDGTPWTADRRNQNIANLLYDPRPPVFITTNRFQTAPPEFRFYLDVNRNGLYDANGLQLEIVRDPQGNLGFHDQNGNFVTYLWPPPLNMRSNFFIGDPEWIGTLERPEFAHAPDNKFVNRYAYYVVPIGNTLDINAIHNQAKNLGFQNEGFLRNEGVGTWEINLAAFLVDLNTNLWPFPSVSLPPFGFQPYVYNLNGGQASTGAAFEDSLASLRYRYNGSYNNLANFQGLYGIWGANALIASGIDGYSAGPVMTGLYLPPPSALPGSWFWAGADNPQHFYTTQELFERAKTGIGVAAGVACLSDRLSMAATNTDSYNRYTFSRLIAQLGTDSAPEPPGKMNLNYDNLVQSNSVTGAISETNFMAWRPIDFFTNAANRLLADAGYTFNTSRIQIWPTNFYTPSVHRLLQLAANMYDATTNRNTAYPYWPSVFRPVLEPTNGGNQVFISGFVEEPDAGFLSVGLPRDLLDPSVRSTLTRTDLAYGVPVVIGAKKGYPNFNEFAMQTQVQVTRKLQFRRLNSPDVNQTNQMFVVTISNVFGVEAWNSYATNYPRTLKMTVLPDVTVSVTNEVGNLLFYQHFNPQTNMPIAAGTWPAYDRGDEKYSFQIPIFTNVLFLSNAVYSQSSRQFTPLTGVFENSSPAFYVPHWHLNLRTRLVYSLIETVGNKVVDFVNLDSTEEPLDLTEYLMEDVPGQTGLCGLTYTPNGSDGSMWCTNHHPSLADERFPTFGILNQVGASLALPNITADWNHALHEFPAGLTQEGAIDFFRFQFDLSALTYPGTTFQKTNVFNAPFQPTRNIYKFTAWQANDPLVHYMIGDLLDVLRTNRVAYTTNDSTLGNLGRVNDRYQPWGWNASRSSSATKTAMQVKDPLVTRSDDWDFPTNKIPNVGWLGRIHRGTPWQTVYLKSPGIDLPTWQAWTGNSQLVTNFGQLSRSPITVATNLAAIPGDATVYDAYLSYPTNDWRVLDLFTAALNANATRGQLSINQTNLAAWSAVLSGVVVLTNSLDGPGGNLVLDGNGDPMLFPMTIQPAGAYNAFDPPGAWPAVAQIVRRINEVRATNSLSQVFSRLSDLLVVPELSVASPFLYTDNTLTPDNVQNNGLNDAAYERIPQQIAGLLKVDTVPRFAVYSYGQTLRPADKSLVTSGSFFGLCTNYQIMAEAATRAVIRIEGAPTNVHAVVESFNLLPPD